MKQETTAVQAALRAAAMAGMNATERHYAEDMHGGEPGPGALHEAAATVAAFLDAMNPHGRRAGFNLAREVEEVARAG